MHGEEMDWVGELITDASHHPIYAEHMGQSNRPPALTLHKTAGHGSIPNRPGKNDDYLINTGAKLTTIGMHTWIIELPIQGTHGVCCWDPRDSPLYVGVLNLTISYPTEIGGH